MPEVSRACASPKPLGRGGKAGQGGELQSLRRALGARAEGAHDPCAAAVAAGGATFIVGMLTGQAGAGLPGQQSAALSPADRYEERLRIFEPSHTSGSYLRSTALSFRGIRALSVILMPSGQTSVQHLVMLQ